MKSKVHLVCDDCDCGITDPRHGELAWAWKDEEKKRVLVVHAPYACPRWKHKKLNLPHQIPERGSEGLDLFVGRAGLLELLERIETEDIPVKMGLELIRRLHVPGYEQERLQRRENIAEGLEVE